MFFSSMTVPRLYGCVFSSVDSATPHAFQAVSLLIQLFHFHCYAGSLHDDWISVSTAVIHLPYRILMVFLVSLIVLVSCITVCITNSMIPLVHLADIHKFFLNICIYACTYPKLPLVNLDYLHKLCK